MRVALLQKVPSSTFPDFRGDSPCLDIHLVCRIITGIVILINQTPRTSQSTNVDKYSPQPLLFTIPGKIKKQFSRCNERGKRE